jgi:predicted ATP-grasp superfamily ATP-dependent carboligase
LIQEIIPGGDDAIHSVVAYMDREHQAVAICSKRKLRQYPIFTGNGCFQISTSQPDLEKSGLKLLRALRYVGPACAVEFKWDARHEQFVLIEINARTEVGQELMTRAGVDIPYIAYMYTMYGKRLDSYTYKTGLKWICFEWDFFSCLEARKKKLYSWMDWIRSLYGIRVFAYFAKDDPFPFFVQTWKFLGIVLRRGFRRIVGRARPSVIPAKAGIQLDPRLRGGDISLSKRIYEFKSNDNFFDHFLNDSGMRGPSFLEGRARCFKECGRRCGHRNGPRYDCLQVLSERCA